MKSVNGSVVYAGVSLKHGFHWLRQQNATDTVIVDDNTDAALLEYLVFMYDSLYIYLSIYLSIDLSIHRSIYPSSYLSI